MILYLRKTYSIILGLITGFIAVLFLDPLFKGLLASLFLKEKVGIYFTGLSIKVNFPISNINSFFLYGFLIISPFILSIILIEITLVWHNKVSNNILRTSIIIFQLMNVGYLIFTAIIGLISIMLQTAYKSDWTLLLNHGELSYNQKLLFMFLVLFILLGYINILIKRIRKSIPVVSRKIH